MTGMNGSRADKRRLISGLCVCAVASLGLLLWARLKIVTNTPRMVYADPKAGIVDDALPGDRSSTQRREMDAGRNQVESDSHREQQTMTKP